MLMAVMNWPRRALDRIDQVLDPITTFRLLLYLLLIYIAGGLYFGYMDKLGFTYTQLLISTVFLVLVCKLSNLALAKVFSIPANHESDIITALILALIMTPATTTHGYAVLAGAAVAAMVSKFVLGMRGRHIFNPAAIGAFTASILLGDPPSWWVGNTHMTWLIVIGGLLILRKMKRFGLLAAFIFVYLFYIFAFLHLSLADPGGWHRLYLDFAATPVIFFATVMLTEPLTSPSRQQNLIIFGVFVGVLYSFTRLHRPPEEALLLGGILAFLLEPNRGLLLKLVSRHKEAAGIYSFVFKPTARIKFKAGQYMEWTLPHTRVDARGNRRYLTIASAPTEKDLMFTVRIPDKHSAFKQSLVGLKPGQKIAAQRLAGDFTVPSDSQKLAFIAGGVGITPFRSMIKEAVDKGSRLDAHLLYSVRSADELAFTNLFEDAAKNGLITNYVTGDNEDSRFRHGLIDSKMVAECISDYSTRRFYISGPQGFVAAVRQALLSMNINEGNIVTDFFPGYN
jgi:ferredoxin-NADP reductase/Na+-translocating ferredoxin:NAD+ oxidoreductase RnfD subunit